jgi:hypothetical protein
MKNPSWNTNDPLGPFGVVIRFRQSAGGSIIPPTIRVIRFAANAERRSARSECETRHIRCASTPGVSRHCGCLIAGRRAHGLWLVGLVNGALLHTQTHSNVVNPCQSTQRSICQMTLYRGGTPDMTSHHCFGWRVSAAFYRNQVCVRLARE